MKIINHKDIMDLNISANECYDWVTTIYKNKEICLLPPKISMKYNDHIFYNVMPSIIDNKKIAGVKIVTRYPQREPALDSQILLYDLNNGNITALLDGNFITTMRTGATAALSINLYAVPNYNEIGLIGLGNTARATIDVLLSITGDRELTIKVYKYKNQAELFAKRYASNSNIKFVECDTYEEVIRNSDVIISSVTYTDYNFGEDEWFKEGVLVIPIHTLGFQNCDLFFDKIFADDIGHIKGFKYFNRFKYVAELSDVLTGKCKGRVNKSERILAYNIGISITDIYFAYKIFNLLDNNKNSIVELTKPSDKFWI